MNTAPYPPPNSSVTAAPDPRRVLVVDDSVVNQRLTVALLKQRGYEVHAVGNGREAVRVLCEEQVPHDVVLMDCFMPEMDGFEAAAEVRALKGPNQRILIIALTGTLEEAQILRCDDSGMNDYLEKPIRIQDFEGALKRLHAAAAPATGPPAPNVRRTPFWDMERLEELRAIEEIDPGEMLTMFFVEASETIKELQAAVAASDVGALQQSSRRLKIAGHYQGLTRISSVCLHLENASRREELKAAVYWFKRLKGLVHQIPDKAVKAKIPLLCQYRHDPPKPPEIPADKDVGGPNHADSTPPDNL